MPPAAVLRNHWNRSTTMAQVMISMNAVSATCSHAGERLKAARAWAKAKCAKGSTATDLLELVPYAPTFPSKFTRSEFIYRFNITEERVPNFECMDDWVYRRIVSTDRGA